MNSKNKKTKSSLQKDEDSEGEIDQYTQSNRKKVRLKENEGNQGNKLQANTILSPISKLEALNKEIFKLFKSQKNSNSLLFIEKQKNLIKKMRLFQIYQNKAPETIIIKEELNDKNIKKENFLAFNKNEKPFKKQSDLVIQIGCSKKLSKYQYCSYEGDQRNNKSFNGYILSYQGSNTSRSFSIKLN